MRRRGLRVLPVRSTRFTSASMGVPVYYFMRAVPLVQEERHKTG